MKKKLRVAILADYLEEGWPSMNLVAESIHSALLPRLDVEAKLLRPPLPQPAGRLLGSRGRNFDRLAGRFFHYPRYLTQQLANFDVYHVTDHSYAQLVNVLPPDRCLVTCHDIDTFRCLLQTVLPNEAENRSPIFRWMSKRILNGLRRAGHVACVSHATAKQLGATGWIPQDRLSVLPNGISEDYFEEPDAQSELWLGNWLRERNIQDKLFILHVGSTIARKRIDVLLKVMAGIRAQRPDVQLLRVGAPLNSEQSIMLRELGLEKNFHALPFLERKQLRTLYRRAALVLQPSSYEGFGLPVAEAMASQAVVLASDIESLREVGGEGAQYCGVGDIADWINKALFLLELRETLADRWVSLKELGTLHVQQFRWSSVANSLVQRYWNLVGLLDAS